MIGIEAVDLAFDLVQIALTLYVVELVVRAIDGIER